MNGTKTSIFNLIEIFRSLKKNGALEAIPQNHCEQKYHHDFYCDAEKPFIENY